jgi:excisionase family DNA binding protein
MSGRQISVQPRLITIQALAAYLSCTLWAARTLLWEEEIPYIKIGKRHLVDLADVDSFIARKRGGL